MVHQRHPHFNYLAIHELMLTDLHDIREASVVSTLAFENFEVVVVVDLARCMIVSHPMACMCYACSILPL